MTDPSPTAATRPQPRNRRWRRRWLMLGAVVLLGVCGLTRTYQVPHVVGLPQLLAAVYVRRAQFTVRLEETGDPRCPRVVLGQDPPGGSVRLLHAGHVTLVVPPPAPDCEPTIHPPLPGPGEQLPTLPTPSPRPSRVAP
jgi:hypothetical protein